MTIIEIETDENTLIKAEEILKSIGLDVQTAINIFLRRVTIEKGLPMQMTAPAPNYSEPATPKNFEVGRETFQTRRNNTITKEMVDGVWNAFLKYRKGLGEINQLKDDVAESTGMNSGSAFIYLNILANLIKGEQNTRNLKLHDLEYLMEKIKTELRPDEYKNAVLSLKKSIPYWREKLPGLFAEHVEKNLNSTWKDKEE